MGDIGGCGGPACGCAQQPPRLRNLKTCSRTSAPGSCPRHICPKLARCAGSCLRGHCTAWRCDTCAELLVCAAYASAFHYARQAKANDCKSKSSSSQLSEHCLTMPLFEWLRC